MFFSNKFLLFCFIAFAAHCAKDPGTARVPRQPVSSPLPSPINGVNTNNQSNQISGGTLAGFEDCGSNYSGNYQANINMQIPKPLIGDVQIQALANLGVQANTGGSDINIQAQVQNVSPSIAKGPVETGMQKLTGPIRSEFVTADERKILLQQNDWRGIRCTILAVKKLQGKEAVLEFKPALPFFVSPVAPPEMYASELSGAKSWQNIQVTVTQSSKVDLKQGETMTGTVNLTSATSGPDGITGDKVYALAFKFGNGTTDMVRLGLFPGMTFYLNTPQKNLAGIVIDTIVESTNQKFVFKKVN